MASTTSSRRSPQPDSPEVTPPPSQYESLLGCETPPHRSIKHSESPSAVAPGKCPKESSDSSEPVHPKAPDSPVTENTCSICLGKITDKCVAGSCLHSFCLICLQEWSKQKPVCPLCKQSFASIMYDIKSETEYKEWKVPPRREPLTDNYVLTYEYFTEHRPFFSYRTTNFSGSQRLRHRFSTRSQSIPDAIPSGPREHRYRRQQLLHRGSSDFRLSVYLNDVWVQPLVDITGHYRETSPQLYREQPALTHRLVAWVNREVAAVLPPARVGVALADIMSLIEQHPINSREFRNAAREHFGPLTDHFVHEFYNFARSPYDMVGHDNAAQYLPHYLMEGANSNVSISSDDSDAVVEVDNYGVPVNTVDGEHAATQNVAREEILTHEGSVVISSDSPPSPDEISGPSPSNPSPPCTSETVGALHATVNDGASTSSGVIHSLADLSEPGPSGISNITASSRNGKLNLSSESSDECTILEVRKPLKERTPDLIDLSSSDNDRPWRKSSVRFNKQVKKKPKLDRVSFTSHLSQLVDYDAEDSASSVISEHRLKKEDHSYCSESTSKKSSFSSHNNSTHQNDLEIRVNVSTRSKSRELYRSSKDEHDEEYSTVQVSSSHTDRSRDRRKTESYDSLSRNKMEPKVKRKFKRDHSPHYSRSHSSSSSRHSVSSHGETHQKKGHTHISFRSKFSLKGSRRTIGVTESSSSDSGHEDEQVSLHSHASSPGHLVHNHTSLPTPVVHGSGAYRRSSECQHKYDTKKIRYRGEHRTKSHNNRRVYYDHRSSYPSVESSSKKPESSNSSCYSQKERHRSDMARSSEIGKEKFPERRRRGHDYDSSCSSDESPPRRSKSISKKHHYAKESCSDDMLKDPTWEIPSSTFYHKSSHTESFTSSDDDFSHRKRRKPFCIYSSDESKRTKTRKKSASHKKHKKSKHSDRDKIRKKSKKSKHKRKRRGTSTSSSE